MEKYIGTSEEETDFIDSYRQLAEKLEAYSYKKHRPFAKSNPQEPDWSKEPAWFDALRAAVYCIDDYVQTLTLEYSSADELTIPIEHDPIGENTGIVARAKRAAEQIFDGDTIAEVRKDILNWTEQIQNYETTHMATQIIKISDDKRKILSDAESLCLTSLNLLDTISRWIKAKNPPSTNFVDSFISVQKNIEKVKGDDEEDNKHKLDPRKPVEKKVMGYPPPVPND